MGLHNSSQAASNHEDVDVVIVGAGLSGLIAARELHKKGHRVHILEARATTGGRMIRQTTKTGAVIDLGGQWGGATHHRFQALVDELNIKTFPSYYDGKGVLLWDGKRVEADLAKQVSNKVLFFEDEQIGQPADQITKAKAAMQAFRAIAASIDSDRPWTAPNAVELDRTTIRAWCDNNSESRLSDFELEWLSVVGGSRSNGAGPGSNELRTFIHLNSPVHGIDKNPGTHRSFIWLGRKRSPHRTKGRKHGS